MLAPAFGAWFAGVPGPGAHPMPGREHDRYPDVVASAAPPVPFNRLDTPYLAMGRVYQAGTAGNWAADPLAQLLPAGN